MGRVGIGQLSIQFVPSLGLTAISPKIIELCDYHNRDEDPSAFHSSKNVLTTKHSRPTTFVLDIHIISWNRHIKQNDITLSIENSLNRTNIRRRHYHFCCWQ